MSPCTVAFGFCINRQLIPAERFFPSDLFVDIFVLMVDCRLSRFDLSAAETEPIIDEFVRLLEAKGIEVQKHHCEGPDFRSFDSGPED